MMICGKPCLVLTATIIPAPMAYIKVVVIKTLIVLSRIKLSYPPSGSIAAGIQTRRIFQIGLPYF